MPKNNNIQLRPLINARIYILPTGKFNRHFSDPKWTAFKSLTYLFSKMGDPVAKTFYTFPLK